ncbi:unnamed protein product, partial [Polarella glacialis]
CCVFVYLNANGQMKCRFMGIAQGNCKSTLAQLKDSVSLSDFTAISDTQVLHECTTPYCNGPDSEENGCPAVVVERPLLTMDLVPTDEPDLA